ncbi:MAG: serine hydrolase [Gemmatimonadetes bacterium]|nr:serine hydrolase [Gemmatimonadota bacterium]MBT5142518.1 serine hydrolase [Gemmatimonadota bacterium]MBT5961185.1 serine hydrolase [Gemmatimonadota bacterium]MBT6627186.1 serine hydrolase [Gemmatimonadota bacterium]MBT7455680.1 serine hydrolase [Gemmatimonadota bacterium]
MADFESVVAMCQDAIDTGVTPGISLACGVRGGASYRSFLGAAALQPLRRELTASTHYDLASLTKVLATTWLTMKRWVETGLDLDAPLGNLLPGYYPADKAGLTIRLLLTHAAGLPSGLRLRDHMDHGTAFDVATRQRAMQHFLQAPLREAPGVDSVYSDIGPILVGDLLEHLSPEQRLDSMCRRELYAPTQMPNTRFLPLIGGSPSVLPHECAATELCPWRDRVVSGQVHDENAFLMDGVAGHAGLFAPLADLEHVAQILLDPPTHGAITQRGVTAFTRRQDIVADSSRALGWDTARAGGPGGDRLSSMAFGHTGFTGTSMWIDPEQGLYVVLLSNRVHPTRDNSAFLTFRPMLHDKIVDILT